MASTRIREARESDCGDIMRMIRVKRRIGKQCRGRWEELGWSGGNRNEGVPLDPVLRASGLSCLNVVLIPPL